MRKSSSIPILFILVVVLTIISIPPVTPLLQCCAPREYTQSASVTSSPPNPKSLPQYFRCTDYKSASKQSTLSICGDFYRLRVNTVVNQVPYGFTYDYWGNNSQECHCHARKGEVYTPECYDLNINDDALNTTIGGDGSRSVPVQIQNQTTIIPERSIMSNLERAIDLKSCTLVYSTQVVYMKDYLQMSTDTRWGFLPFIEDYGVFSIPGHCESFDQCIH